MNIDSCGHDRVHLLGESATHPIEPRCGTLVALLLLAGMSPQRRRPCRPRRARTPASSPGANRPQDGLCPGLALPAHRIAAHSGAPNCGF